MSAVIFKPGNRCPLRSVTELCEELGVTRRVMSGLLGRSDAPTKVLRSASQFAVNSYFEPKAFRAWYANIDAEQFA